MRNSYFGNYKPDIRFILAFAITLACSIICGIVLYKPVTCNAYFRDFASEYVYNVFNFKNFTLIIPHAVSDLIFFYVLFFVCYFTKFKYATLALIFIKGLFLGIYSSLLVVVCAFSGVLVLLLVFLPSTLVSLAICLVIAEGCKLINKKNASWFPAIFALADCILLVILINILFRVVIIIV